MFNLFFDLRNIDKVTVDFMLPHYTIDVSLAGVLQRHNEKTGTLYSFRNYTDPKFTKITPSHSKQGFIELLVQLKITPKGVDRHYYEGRHVPYNIRIPIEWVSYLYNSVQFTKLVEIFSTFFITSFIPVNTTFKCDTLKTNHPFIPITPNSEKAPSIEIHQFPLNDKEKVKEILLTFPICKTLINQRILKWGPVFNGYYKTISSLNMRSLNLML